MSADQIPSDVVTRTKAILGHRYDALLAVMLDLAVPPIFLFSDDRVRLVDARRSAVDVLHERMRQDHAGIERLAAQLPAVLRVPDPAEGLLEAAAWHDYFRCDLTSLRLPERSDAVLMKATDLWERHDDDGLLDLDGLRAEPQALFHAGLSIHYHQLMRRGFASGMNTDLLATLLRAAIAGPARLRVAVDTCRLRFESEHMEVEERDRWFGPSLNDALLDDPHLCGETVHGDPEQGLSLLNPYSATSFRWTLDDGPFKTIQIEEMVPNDGTDDALVLVRYMHAIRDTQERRFVHCDAAVKAYDAETYPRAQADFRDRPRSTGYRKVFRLDGTLHTGMWSQITGQWFRGNQLVQEYLHGLAAPR